jgi:hypothetical protein
VWDAGSGAGALGNGAAVEVWENGISRREGTFCRNGVTRLRSRQFKCLRRRVGEYGGSKEGMAGNCEVVGNFLQMFAVIGFHHLLLNCVCLSVEVSKSALRSYAGLTLIHPFTIAAAFGDRARMSCASMPISAKSVHNSTNWEGSRSAPHSIPKLGTFCLSCFGREGRPGLMTL